MQKCKWCRNTGKILLVDNYVNCTECERGKQAERNDKKESENNQKIFDQYQKGQNLINTAPPSTIIQPEIKKEIIVPTPKPIQNSGINPSTANPWKPSPMPYNMHVPGGGFYDHGVVGASSRATIIGNAGNPGCGTSSITTKKYEKILFWSEEIPAQEEIEFEILAGRVGAFKPRSIQLLSKRVDDLSIYVPIKILDVSVMGTPQFVNYTYEKSNPQKYLDSEFLQKKIKIDWAVFGSSKGQGLKWKVFNPNYDRASLSIMIKGDPADITIIGCTG